MRIRQAIHGDEAGIADLRVHSWQCTYHGIVPDETLKTLGREERLQQWQDALKDVKNAPGKKVVFVAEENGKIVGFVCGGVARGKNLRDEGQFDCELYAIHIDEDYQGRGMGQALFATLKNWLVDHGFSNMFLWAFADNPFIHFYPKVGGVLGDEEHVNSSIGVPIKIVRYDWPELKKDVGP